MHAAVCKDISSSSFSLGEQVGERSVVHKANERQLVCFPWGKHTFIRRIQPPSPTVGARGRMLISPDLFLSPSSSPLSLCLSFLFIL